MSDPGSRRLRLAPAALVIVAGAAASAGTISAAPAWAKGLGPTRPGPHPAMTTCSVVMRLSWKGMLDAGRLQVDFAPKGVRKSGRFVTRANANSLGPAAGLFPYSGSMWSEVYPSSLRPRLFSGTETDRRETTVTTCRYFSNRVVCTQSTTPRGKSTPKLRTETFRFAPVHDLFSAILLIRSQKLADGDTARLVIQPFRSPYLLKVKVLGHEKHLDRPSIKMSIELRKIDRKTLALKPYKKMKREAILWLSDDKDRIPLEFRAPVFIGDVRATLSGFTKP